MANEAPKRIWTDDECHYETRNPYRSHAVEYIRADLATLSSDAAADRINAYLQSGGLFNPDLAEHDAVRDLLIDCRTELDQLRDRVKELENALEPFDEALDDEGNPDEFDKPDDLPIDPGSCITYGELRTARRVREGGKVDG